MKRNEERNKKKTIINVLSVVRFIVHPNTYIVTVTDAIKFRMINLILISNWFGPRHRLNGFNGKEKETENRKKIAGGVSVAFLAYDFSIKEANTG